MFSGIVESTVEAIKDSILSKGSSLTFKVVRPVSFDDLKLGDSIAVNGICLTVEAMTSETLQFTMGSETLKILSKNVDYFLDHKLNLERSLRYGDRVHGHLVTGHVEGLGRVEHVFQDGESWLMQIKLPASLVKNVWSKGSIALNGVSLTINLVDQDCVGVCLIPETIKKTNLVDYPLGSFVTVETDYYAKVLYLKGEV
jgi:riboflavin synthase